MTWLNDAGAYETRCRELAELRERVAAPGACARVAEYVLAVLRTSGRARSEPAA